MRVSNALKVAFTALNLSLVSCAADWSSSEEDGDASEKEDDVPLAKRQKAAKVAARAPKQKPLPASKPAQKRSRVILLAGVHAPLFLHALGNVSAIAYQ